MSERSNARFYRRFSVSKVSFIKKTKFIFYFKRQEEILYLKSCFKSCAICYSLTACLGLLKWLVDKINIEGENAARSPTGTIPLKALNFAIRRCSDYIRAQSHEDLDQEIEKVWSHQWDQFINWYYKIIQNQALFVHNNVPFNVRL